MSVSTTTESRRFWLDSARLAAHVIASEDELFGIDNEHEGGFAAAIADRFWQAADAGAIRCPEAIVVQLYVLPGECLLVAVRARGPPAGGAAAAGCRLRARGARRRLPVRRALRGVMRGDRPPARGGERPPAGARRPARRRGPARRGGGLIMGWTCGALDGSFSSRAAIAIDLGDGFAGRVIANARYGTVIYAAVRSAHGADVFGLVLLAERRDGASAPSRSARTWARRRTVARRGSSIS